MASAQAEGKETFLTELSEVCQKNIFPKVIGGDFNIIRSCSEKINLLALPNGVLFLMQ